jgi:hypothetical protein
MKLEMNMHERACTFYMKWCVQVKSYTHGVELCVFDIISDDLSCTELVFQEA